ncbi:hypothetical protein D3C76_179780 [compost metagenome]
MQLPHTISPMGGYHHHEIDGMRPGAMLALFNGGVAGVTGVAAGHNLLKLLGNVVVTP